MIIGVFDSGVGGLSVANAITYALPNHQVLLREDKQNLPYGDKSPEQLYKLVLHILLEMEKSGCQVIVIACNTVTTNIITELRVAVGVPLVGMEPMVKPAASLTKTGVIGVCATPATLKSKRYKWLKAEYCENVAVIEPNVENWAQMIESDEINIMSIKSITANLLQKNVDVIVLGCTHYHWIEELIQHSVGNRAIVVQPQEAVIRQLTRVIEQID